MSNLYQQGQRWISESEPELGLGSVIRITDRTVLIAFPAVSETREYAQDNAPLRRVRFRVGDSIRNRSSDMLLVESVSERSGLIYYRTPAGELCETELNDAISFNKPEERLLAGQVDEPSVFDLRLSALEHQHRCRRSEVRGFVGGRIDLIPHQLFIASEVSRRLAPRVLLADEVGLGKTIEACLVLHRLILTGRVQRALILVPESLVHQWFVELMRRFNLWFAIFDEERCRSIEATHPDANPFQDDQLVLASIGLFVREPRRLEQALEAGWDILVVDEAHHLGWSPDVVSSEYRVVEMLGNKTPGLLLLTATPEQLGMESHFARLRLLDPNRFHDFSEFIKETGHYREVASVVEKLMSNQTGSNDAPVLARIVGEREESVRIHLENAAAGNFAVRDQLISALLDRHGTGRVMFRNTRATVTGFPGRTARLHPLRPPKDSEKLFHRLAEEFAADTDSMLAEEFDPDFKDDPRIVWLAELLRTLGGEKILLICRTQAKVEEIEIALRRQINVKMAVFHESLSLVQRDRNASWFAEEDGARLLICSEIGSEGRNFQFAHHLVLFDLPLDPELLEQRIGRLDRIGQTSQIHIHIPYVSGSSQEVLAHWYHHGLNSFEANLPAGRKLLEQFGARVHDLAQDFHETGEPAREALEQLIAETIEARKKLAIEMEQGRDRLLELNSFRSEPTVRMIEQMRQHDGDTSLDRFMLSVFDQHGIQVEELAPRTFYIGSAGVFADVFPGLPAEGMTVTADRQRALSHETVQFLTWDHPIVTGALDLLLGSEKGNSSFALWPDETPGLYLEAVYVLECIAPPLLHADRFLPPTPMRVMVNHRGEDVSDRISREMLVNLLKPGEPYTLLDRSEFREELLPALLEKTEQVAGEKVPGLVENARKAMRLQFDQEINRLRELQKVNQTVRPEEIELLIQHRESLDKFLEDARLRLDAVRVIQRG